MFRIRVALVLAVFSLLAIPAFAEEILHFTSGSALPVVSHTVKGEMVRVDLGDNSFMEFPIANIVRIETAGDHVNLKSGNKRASSVMRVVSNPEAAAEEASRQADNSRRRQEEEDFDPAVEIDDKGVAVYRPMANSQQVAKRDTGFAGNARVRTGSGAKGAVRGTRQVGNKMVIGTNGPRGRTSGGRNRGSPNIEFKPQAGSTPAAPPTGTTSGQSESN